MLMIWMRDDKWWWVFFSAWKEGLLMFDLLLRWDTEALKELDQFLFLKIYLFLFEHWCNLDLIISLLFSLLSAKYIVVDWHLCLWRHESSSFSLVSPNLSPLQCKGVVIYLSGFQLSLHMSLELHEEDSLCVNWVREMKLHPCFSFLSCIMSINS